MSANPAIEFDINALPTIDISQLNAVLGGEGGWGETIGGWLGAAGGGALGFAAGTPLGPVGQAGLSAGGAAVGWDAGRWAGRQVDGWFGGGK